MAVYKNDTLIEQSIYGSSRLGLMTASSKAGYRTLGGKKYELSNHLGNVLAVVSDNIHLDQDYTWASVVNVTDYYPFGLAMDGRSVQDSCYRYGFNGKENDPEGMGGGGSTYDYGFRIYSPLIARFLSIDPLTDSYPWYTPYQYAGNKPIRFIDIEGLEEGEPRIFWDWNIDMNNAPDKYKGPLMKESVKSTYTATGYARNNAYYWNKVLEKDANALDRVNANRVKYGGASPKVSPELIAHLKNTKGIDLSSYEGQTLVHHHVNQGRTAVAMPTGDHTEFSGRLHQITRKGKVRSRGGTIGKIGSLLGPLADFSGYLRGDPHNTWVMFSKPDIGEVRFEAGEGFYYTITSAVNNDSFTSVIFQRFSDYRWDDEQKKYVGFGYLDTYTETYDKNTGRSSISKSKEL